MSTQFDDNDFDQMFGNSDNNETSDKKNVFTVSEENSVLDDLDKDDSNEEESTDDNKSFNLDDIDNEEEEEDSRTDSELIDTPIFKAVNSLVEKGIFKVFVDDEGNPEKELTEYTSEDFEELITQNIQDAISTASEKAPVELFKKLPQSVQDVVVFALSGGKESDLPSMFGQLAKVQQTLDLDPSKKEDALKIVREFHQMEGILSSEDIEDEITQLEDSEKLTVYAEKYKKRLDEKQALVLKKRLADQDLLKKQEIANETKKVQNVISVLKSPDVSGVIFDNDTKQDLFVGLSERRFQSLKGEPINELQYLLEQKQYGENPDLNSVVLALAILKDPTKILNSLETKIKKEVASNTQQVIKDGNRKLANTTAPNTVVDKKIVSKKQGINRTSVFSLG